MQGVSVVEGRGPIAQSPGGCGVLGVYYTDLMFFFFLFQRLVCGAFFLSVLYFRSGKLGARHIYMAVFKRWE